MEKLEWWGYRMVKKTLRITVYTQYRRVTDRHIEMAYSPRYAYAMHTLRAVKKLATLDESG